MKYHWKDQTLRQVTALLQDALRPIVDMRVAALQPRADQQHNARGPLIRLRDETGAETTLAILPWESKDDFSQPYTPLWVLQKATKRVREQLRRDDQNFVDTAGAVRLHLPGILVDRTDLKPPTLERASEVRNPFSDRNSLVVRSLIELRPDATITLKELADRAGVSLASTSYVIRALEKSQLVDTTRTTRGLEISAPDTAQIISQWANRYDWTRNTAITFLAPMGAPERFLARLRPLLASHRWALTLQAGAAQVAPHANWDHVHLYMDAADQAEVADLTRRAGWVPSPAGKVTVLLPHYKQSVWQGIQVLDQYPVVSTLQLILDLWHYPVRGREQALHLMETQPLSQAHADAPG